MKSLLSAGFLALAATTAGAADLAVKASPYSPAAVAYSWTGFYLGANVAYSWQNFGFPDPDVGSMKAKGVMGGVTLGADYQIRDVVIGVIGDVDFGNVGITVPNGTVMTESAREKMFATVRGRVGYLITPQLLLYATGGLAIASVDQTETCPPGAQFGFCSRVGAYSLTANNIFIGSVVGAGAEWMFAPHWSTKIEYLYSDLGSSHFNLGSTPAAGAAAHIPGSPGAGTATNPRDISLTQQQVRLGVNYRF